MYLYVRVLHNINLNRADPLVHSADYLKIKRVSVYKVEQQHTH